MQSRSRGRTVIVSTRTGPRQRVTSRHRNLPADRAAPRTPGRGLTARLLAATVLALAGTAAAAAGYPPPTECPQPRFTGQAPEPLRSTPNPLPASEEQIGAGEDLYQRGVQPSCRICHGEDGDGRGPLSAQFDPRPRNFACEATVEGIPDGQLFWIIKNGSPGTAMPDFGDKLTDEQIWQIVHYLRALAE